MVLCCCYYYYYYYYYYSCMDNREKLSSAPVMSVISDFR